MYLTCSWCSLSLLKTQMKWMIYASFFKSRHRHVFKVVGLWIPKSKQVESIHWWKSWKTNRNLKLLLGCSPSQNWFEVWCSVIFSTHIMTSYPHTSIIGQFISITTCYLRIAHAAKAMPSAATRSEGLTLRVLLWQLGGDDPCHLFEVGPAVETPRSPADDPSDPLTVRGSLGSTQQL